MAKRPHMPCDACRFRKFTQDDPYSLLGWFWNWHTKWCPGWKSYLKQLREHGAEPPEHGSLRGVWDEEN